MGMTVYPGRGSITTGATAGVGARPSNSYSASASGSPSSSPASRFCASRWASRVSAMRAASFAARAFSSSGLSSMIITPGSSTVTHLSDLVAHLCTTSSSDRPGSSFAMVFSVSPRPFMRTMHSSSSEVQPAFLLTPRSAGGVAEWRSGGSTAARARTAMASSDARARETLTWPGSPSITLNVNRTSSSFSFSSSSSSEISMASGSCRMVTGATGGSLAFAFLATISARFRCIFSTTTRCCSVMVCVSAQPCSKHNLVYASAASSKVSTVVHTDLPPRWKCTLNLPDTVANLIPESPGIPVVCSLISGT
mmetsp:Transcript_8678/g.39162  ORF Transcript_8678/g.39162 Transcript_8678/m.39162 type:complete len:309 (+) Transcript_8678:16-942(+)